VRRQGSDVRGYRVAGDVVFGTLPVGTATVQLVGSRLLAAKQSTLHAFGMLADAATCVGHLMGTDALFAEQRRATNPSRSAAARGPATTTPGVPNYLIGPA
jgi:hypothetical protein